MEEKEGQIIVYTVVIVLNSTSTYHIREELTGIADNIVAAAILWDTQVIVTTTIIVTTLTSTCHLGRDLVIQSCQYVIVIVYALLCYHDIVIISLCHIERAAGAHALVVGVLPFSLLLYVCQTLYLMG